MSPRQFTKQPSLFTGPALLRTTRLATVALALSSSFALATGDFYEQPLVTLSDYLKLDQLPAKSIGDIHEETSKSGEKAPQIQLTSELLGLTKKPGPEALASLDKMIAAARAKANSPLLNLLHDLRDLFAGPANASESAAYVEWRIEQADRFGVVLDEKKQAEQKASPDRSDAANGPNRELIADIERHLAKASPALKPHWLYLRGAAEYLGHSIGESQPWFLKVIKEFPKSPRAEVALYMAARCQMWRTRSQDYTQQDMKLVASERPQARKLFDEYFSKYPHGTYLGDMLGWAGAYAFDGQDFGAALRYYAQQLDLPDHPELEVMAAEMIEKTLSHIASVPNEKSFAEVARFPRAAQALVYLIINTSESDNFNGKFDSIDEVRGWRKKVLPRLAAAISAQGKLYQAADWKPRYLAMLAFAASGAGQQEQAIKLLDNGGAGAAAEESDDLLMARGVVLHRAHRPAEAAKALEALLAKFPDSPLVKGARLRLGLALTDDHRAGQAVLALTKLLPKPKDPGKKPDDATTDTVDDDSYEMNGESPILYPIDINQIRALIDILLNFAPVEELAAAAQTPNLDPVLRLQFTETIAQRLLAKEQFAEAKKFLTPAQFGLFAGPLEALTEAARNAKEPAAHAAACVKVGDAWAAARGKLLTYPLDTNERRREVYIDYAAEADGRRADSAPYIGATGNYRGDLENRDELRHAFNWWLEASDAQPGTPLTAQAIWRALNAMPKIADVSPYTVERATLRTWGNVARKLYDRLRTECPDSVEAKRYAVVWSFPPMKKPKPDEGNYPVFRDAAGGKFSTAADEDQSGAAQDNDVLIKEVNSLESLAGGADLHKAQARAETLRVHLRQTYTSQYDARWVNLVDDLALFLSEPDPGAAVRTRYAEMRFRFVRDSAIGGGWRDSNSRDSDGKLRADIEGVLDDRTNKPVADYFAFLNLAVIANHRTSVDLDPKAKKPEADVDNAKEVDTYTSRDYPKLEKETRAFLEKYPKSKKREAAMLLYARAAYRASEQIALPKLVMWPQGARWEGGYELRYTQQEPFDAKRVLGALDAYDREFPKGLYLPDIRNYRAGVAVRQHEWKTAVDLTVAQLSGQDNPGLNSEAANRLGEIFAQLADERYRADVLAAIKENKKAREYLEKYLGEESDTNPLLYLKSWLREQLAAK